MNNTATKPANQPDIPPFEVLRPAEWTAPVVFASPHSGRHYPPAFVAASQMDPTSLRRSEDAFIDEIFGTAPDHGAPLLCANFPRAFIDPNREAWELDPNMFDGPLPSYVNTSSPRIAAGLGTIARVVTNGENIYASKLSFEDARLAIESHYMPYHEALAELLAEASDRFGGCLLVDCHSMPSIGVPMDRDPGFRRVDFVLGDRHGEACAAEVTDLARSVLESQDYLVTRNNPYAGGFTTVHYGRPKTGVHALQIEINRGLYMDEMRVQRMDGLAPLRDNISRLIETLAAIDSDMLRPAP